MKNMKVDQKSGYYSICCCFVFEGILAISKINEYIEKGNPDETLEMLKLPEAKLENVDDKQAYSYQVSLIRKKKEKAEVYRSFIQYNLSTLLL